MRTRSLCRRMEAIRARTDPPLDPPVRAFARAVIRFGGHEQTPQAVEGLARWYAGG